MKMKLLLICLLSYSLYGQTKQVDLGPIISELEKGISNMEDKSSITSIKQNNRTVVEGVNSLPTPLEELRKKEIIALYSFNNNKYVIIRTKEKSGEEVTKYNFNGKYMIGDDFLGFKITDINSQTNTIRLSKVEDGKKLKKNNKEEGFVFYDFSNHGVSIIK